MAASSPLAEQVHREIAACIGCHDCLLACPLPEASDVGIAELNAAVSAPVIRAANVARFVTACTQCGQCIPACPADLSRAAMVLFNKNKLEDAAPDRQLQIHVGAAMEASLMTLDGLTRELGKLRMFGGVLREEVRRFVGGATLRRLAPHDMLCREGEYHDRLVIVIAGTLEQVTREGVRILGLGPGSFIGEMAVVADQPEPFTVLARATSVVVEAPKAAVHRLMQASPAFRETMESLYARRAIHTYASRANALGGLPEKAIAELLAAASLVPLVEGEVLVQEGDPPEDVFLVRAGFLRVTRRLDDASATAEVLVYFREGDLFGALSIVLDEEALPFTVRAVGRAEVIRLPGAVFRRALDRHPETRTLWGSGALEAERGARLQGSGRPKAGARDEAASAPTDASVAQKLSWDVLVEKGLAEGRALLAIDQLRCTYCGSCVEACERRHGMSRLQLSGIQVEHLLFPTACRHCDDPVCLMCSVGGIVRRPGGEISIVEDNCIGCGACAERCPYGNIQIHAAEVERPGLWRRLVDFLRGAPPGERARDLDSAAPRKAVKCDLCAGHDDYACVTACPVGAAFRADPEALIAAGVSGDDVFAGLRAR